MLIAGAITGACLLIFLLAMRHRAMELHSYGVTKQMREDAHTSDPDETSIKPEEFS